MPHLPAASIVDVCHTISRRKVEYRTFYATTFLCERVVRMRFRALNLLPEEATAHKLLHFLTHLNNSILVQYE